MFEKYIDKYKELLEANFTGIGESTTLSDVVNLEIPQPIKTFIENDIKRWVKNTSDDIFDEEKFEAFSDDIISKISHHAKLKQ